MLRVRLARGGCTHRPHYSIVVADSRSPRDGRFLEKVGVYDPMVSENKIQCKEDRIRYWLGCGAQMSYRVHYLLSKLGVVPAPFTPRSDKSAQPKQKSVERKKKREEKAAAAQA